MERGGQDLEGKGGQDLVANLVRTLVANLVDIQTGSTVHWRVAFITTGDYAGSRLQQEGE